MRALRYAFDEAMVSLWRGRHSGALSTATIAVALFVLGAFLIATANLEQLGREWNNSAEMSIYLTEGATQAQRTAIEKTLSAAGVVASQQYLSKADALARFKKTFADLSGTLDGLGDNPLPASYEVRLRGGVETGVDLVLAELRQLPGVADVRYDREWLQRLSRAIGMVRGVGLVLGLLLTVAAALTVANVVRLGLPGSEKPLPGAARLRHQPVTRELSPPRANPAGRGRRDARRLCRGPDRGDGPQLRRLHRLDTCFGNALYWEKFTSTVDPPREPHATNCDRDEADQRAAPDHGVLPRGVFETSPLSAAAAAVLFRNCHHRR